VPTGLRPSMLQQIDGFLRNFKNIIHELLAQKAKVKISISEKLVFR